MENMLRDWLKLTKAMGLTDLSDISGVDNASASNASAGTISSGSVEPFGERYGPMRRKPQRDMRVYNSARGP